jgi:hypothetical protein
LPHGRFRHQKRPRDLRRRQPAEQAQRESDPGGLANAGWQQVKISRSRSSGTGPTSALPAEPADPVDRPVAGGRDDPAGRARRHPVGRPSLDGRGESLLDGFLGEVEVAEVSGQDGHRAAVLGAVDVG